MTRTPPGTAGTPQTPPDRSPSGSPRPAESAGIAERSRTHRGIVVTGTHRSGSTWVGRMLAASPGVAYIYEPFNPFHRPGTFTARITHWFPYITSPADPAMDRAVEHMLQFHYGWGAELRSLRRPRDAARMVRDAARFGYWRVTGARPLLKDPFALFVAPYLADRFGLDVVVLIRHPAAFAVSLIRKGWSFPFSHLLEQRDLMEGPLQPFADEIAAATREPPPLLDQATLLWRVIHTVILDYRNRRPDWVFARHEDLAADPINAFTALYERLGLQMTPQARQTIELATSSDNPSQPDGAGELHRRDSRKSIGAWKRKMSDEDVRRVRDGAGEVGDAFYSDEDW
jgi:hypothetical protein